MSSFWMKSNSSIAYLPFHNRLTTELECRFGLFYVFRSENKASNTKIMGSFDCQTDIRIVNLLVIITAEKVLVSQISSNIKGLRFFPESLLIFKLRKQIVA
jgi:hypothetical protein